MMNKEYTSEDFTQFSSESRNVAEEAISDQPVVEYATQKEGLTSIDLFLRGNIPFEELKPVLLPLSSETEVNADERTKLFSYYISKRNGESLYLKFRLPSEAYSGTDIVLASPKKDERGSVPYYWLDVYPYDEVTTMPMTDDASASIRMHPTNERAGFESLYWRSIDEQILTDFFLDINNISSDELNPIKIRTHGKTYRLSSRKDLHLQFGDNDAMLGLPEVILTGKTDEQEFYKWLEVADPITGENIGLYRYLPEEHRFTIIPDFTAEEQLISDYLEGQNRVMFENLRPFTVHTLPKSDYIPIGKRKRIYTPRDGSMNDKDFLIVPRRDDDGLYEWLEIFAKAVDETSEDPYLNLHDEPVLSVQMNEGRFVQKKWLGSERQRVVDYLDGKLQFDRLVPLHLNVGKTDSIAIAKFEGKKISFSLSKYFNLQQGQPIIFTPIGEQGESLSFLLTSEGMELGLYELNIVSKKFTCVENYLPQKSGEFQIVDGIYIDTQGDEWVPIHRLSNEYQLAYPVIQRLVKDLPCKEGHYLNKKITLYDRAQIALVVEEYRQVKPKRTKRLKMNQHESIEEPDLSNWFDQFFIEGEYDVIEKT